MADIFIHRVFRSLGTERDNVFISVPSPLETKGTKTNKKHKDLVQGKYI
jgi:hypothetical protein